MEKNKYIGKTIEEAINKAKIDLQETQENLIINVLEEKKMLLNKKVEIEVIEKRKIKDYLKTLLTDILYTMGYQIEIEVKMKDEVPTYCIYSNNDALLIGKNGKNLEALRIYLNQVLNKEIGTSYKFILDVSDYKEKVDKNLKKLARKLASEVASSKIEVKMDSMNSYQRRIVHNELSKNKYVYTQSIGQEPNRAVIIKPKED